MIGAYAFVSIFLFVVARYVCMRFCMQGRIQHPRYIWVWWVESGLVWGWILQLFKYFTLF